MISKPIYGKYKEPVTYDRNGQLVDNDDVGAALPALLSGLGANSLAPLVGQKLDHVRLGDKVGDIAPRPEYGTAADGLVIQGMTQPRHSQAAA